MWNEIINLAISNGLFAVLFLGLLVYQLKDSRARERKYQLTIEKLSTALTLVDKLNEKVEEIGENIHVVKTDIVKIKSNLTRKLNKDKEKSNEILATT